MAPDIETHPWYHRAHHADGTFRNLEGPPQDVPPLKAARWILEHAFQRKQQERPSVHTPTRAVLAAPPTRLRITWIGHATTYIQTPMLDLLTDPVFSRRASPIPFLGPDRKPPLPLALEDLPGVDAVLISHSHYDHLDRRSIREVQRRFAPLFLVPLGLAKILHGWGARRIVEMDWWQFVDVNGMRYHCAPAKHFSARGLHDRNETLWASWYLEALDERLDVYFAGDTAYGAHFKEVRVGLGAPDVALLPIGAYRPRWFMQPVHVDPQEAVRALLDLQARHAIGIHWGTFDLSDEPLQEAPALARRYAAHYGVADRLHLLEIGGHFTLDRVRAPVGIGAGEKDS